jgi:hypothetical protein
MIMENEKQGNSGRESFDTENSQASENTRGNDAQASSTESGKITNADLDPRYDTNPNRNNFGLDDSPLDSAEWNKESTDSDERNAHRKEALDTESNEDTDSQRRDDRNISFDRDL